MAAKYTATAEDTDQTLTRRGVEFPAKRVTCTCAGCGGVSVLVPAATVESRSAKATLHNYVAQRAVLGFPTV